MTIVLQRDTFNLIQSFAENAYPEEGAGLLLGRAENDTRIIEDVLELNNAREASSRRNRYLITARDMLAGERTAEAKGMDVLGVFHSHPDHPAQPSEFDREWAMPWFSYIITSVHFGETRSSRSWRLQDDRTRFIEEDIQILDTEKTNKK